MAAVVFRSSAFRDTDYHNRLFTTLNEQRSACLYCDVILKVKDNHIYAHSNILAAASPYFSRLFREQQDGPRSFCEKAPQVIEIQIDGEDPGRGYIDAVQHVVEYMYTCSLDLNNVIINHINEIAGIMEMQKVQRYCERFLNGDIGIAPTDKQMLTTPPLIDNASVSVRRVKKTNASTETELALFTKSSGLTVEQLQEKMIQSSNLSSEAEVNFVDSSQISDPEDQPEIRPNYEAPADLDQKSPVGGVSGQEASNNAMISVMGSQGATATDSNLCLDSAPMVMVKDHDGTLRGAISIPFINVPMPEDGMQEGISSFEDAHAFFSNESATVKDDPCTTQTFKTHKVPSTRGRKRGRPCLRGRPRKQKVKEALSDSDSELIQESECPQARGCDSETKPSIEIDTAAENLPLEEAEDMKDSILDRLACNDQGVSAPDIAATSTGESTEIDPVEVKQESTELLSRTRGRKPITSVMASWTSPRRRAGIPRSMFRSDYVMHSLIKRSRQHTAASLPDVTFDDSDLTGVHEMPEVCDALAKAMEDSSVLQSSSTIKFVCQTCDFATVSFRLYRQHMKRHPETDTRSYTCTECNFHTTKARQLLQHRKQHLHEDFICSYCELQLDCAENFEAHLQRHVHVLPYFCYACDMRFKTRTQLATHLPKHGTEKPFVCQICGNGFKWKHALKSHMVTHSATKDHLCDICGFATAHKSQLKAHKLIHTGDTFKCQQPGCVFEATKRQNLKYHMVTHTQEKAHQCEVCGQAFSLIKNMRRHMLLHKDTRPYHCSVCSYTSTRYDKLKEHKLKQHNIGDPPGKKMRVADMRYLPHGTIAITEDGTVVRSAGMEGLHMLPVEPITIAQEGNNITIRSDVSLTDEALQTIAQIAAASPDAVCQEGQPREAQINIATSEGIPIIARVQFTGSVDSEVVNYVTQVKNEEVIC